MKILSSVLALSLFIGATQVAFAGSKNGSSRGHSSSSRRSSGAKHRSSGSHRTKTNIPKNAN